MSKKENVVVVGASHCAAQLVVSLRQGGWDGNIIVIGDEPCLPYHRPPLSKDYLAGSKALNDILLRPPSVYENANIEMRLGQRVTEINRDAHTVTTQDGEVIPYTKLVLATGARVRPLPIEGADLDHVYYLRSREDVQAIKAEVAPGKTAVIIGGGYIGLETAASLRKQGLEVTLLEAMPRILQRVTAPELSKFYKRVHEEEGVKIYEGVSASAIEKSETGLAVKTRDGQTFTADFVIIGIGVIPNSELAAQAGLEVGNGIIVNEFAQTNDPDIYAGGDVSWHYNPKYDRHIRLESVPNATEQAKTIASHINGTPKIYDSLPWFWSDQYDLKLQIAGLSEDFDDLVIRGDIDGSRSFAAFYFKGDQFLAVDAVNAPRDFMMAKMALNKGMTLDKSVLADPDAELKAAMIEP